MKNANFMIDTKNVKNEFDGIEYMYLIMKNFYYNRNIILLVCSILN